MISVASSSISWRNPANGQCPPTMCLQPREVVVADDREVEAGLLGEGDVALWLLRACLLAHHW